MDRRKLAKKVKLSRHARQRGAQRNLSDAEMRYVVRHGKRFHRRGRRIYFLRRCDVPEEDLAHQERSRLVGTAVIVDGAGKTILTAWRDRQDGLKQIKRMPRRRIGRPEPLAAG